MLNSPPNCLFCSDFKTNNQTTCTTQFLNSTEQPKCLPNVISSTAGSQEQTLFTLQNYYHPSFQGLVTYSGARVLQTNSYLKDRMSDENQHQQLQTSMAAVSLEPTSQNLSTSNQPTAMQKPLQFQQNAQHSESFQWEHNAQYQNVPTRTTISRESVVYPPQQLQQPSPMHSNFPETLQYPKLPVRSLNTVGPQSEAQITTSGNNFNRGWQPMMENTTMRMQNYSGPPRRFYRRQIFRRRRDPFKAKIIKKAEKKKRNAYLKNLLVPKNALSTLQELCPEVKISVSEVQTGNQMQYATKVEIDNKVYDGSGESEDCAKEIGSENALKAVLLKKLEQLEKNFDTGNVKSGFSSDVEMEPNRNAEGTMDISEEVEGGGGSSTSTSTVHQRKSRNKDKKLEEDASWSALARFAIFKLFAEWRNQELTEQSSPEVMFREKELEMERIANAAPRKHPVQFLLELKPNCQFVEKREGATPNLTFTCSVEIDGNTYIGSGRNVRVAKKECAKSALDALGASYTCL